MVVVGSGVYCCGADLKAQPKHRTEPKLKVDIIEQVARQQNME